MDDLRIGHRELLCFDVAHIADAPQILCAAYTHGFLQFEVAGIIQKGSGDEAGVYLDTKKWEVQIRENGGTVYIRSGVRIGKYKTEFRANSKD